MAERNLIIYLKIKDKVETIAGINKIYKYMKI